MNNVSVFIANQFLVQEMDIYLLYRLSINLKLQQTLGRICIQGNKVNKDIPSISKHKK